MILETLLDVERFYFLVAERLGLNVQLFLSRLIAFIFSSRTFDAFFSWKRTVRSQIFRGGFDGIIAFAYLEIEPELATFLTDS